MQQSNFQERRRHFDMSRIVALILACLLGTYATDLRADPGYKVTAGKVSFTVGTNVAFLKVSGASSALKGGGEGMVAGDVAKVRAARFELDPKTLRTGIGLRDHHMYESVFTAPDGSMPSIILKTDAFEAKRDSATGKWEATFQAQLTLRGVTRPVRFHGLAEEKGGNLIITADGVVKPSEFGVKPIAYSGATVDDQVTVRVSDLRVQR